MATPIVRTAEDIRKLGTIMGIWAHPDDETFTSAGLLGTAIENGQTVICLTATKGEEGLQDEAHWAADTLADARAQELQAALQVLGIKHHHWLGYRDCDCDKADPAEAIEQLSKYISQYQPDTILSFGPDGFTGHPDHQAVSAWANAAAKQAGRPVAVYHVVQSQQCYDNGLKELDAQFDIFFKIDKPPLRDEVACDICYCLPEPMFDKKIQALKAQPSQTAELFTAVPMDTLHAAYIVECFERSTV